MQILYLCHRIPYPPNKGEKIRAFQQLRAISTRHEVDVFTLADDPRDLAQRDALAAYCRELTISRVRPKMARLRSLPYLFTNQPLTIPYFFSSELASAIQSATVKRHYDRIFIYCSAMAQYAARVHGIPVVLDLVDVDSNKWKQYSANTRFPFSRVYAREARTLEAYERLVCEKADCVLVSTDREAQLLRRIATKASVQTVPNGVDINYFNVKSATDSSRAPAVIFTGDMSYLPNQEAVSYFAREVLPIIRKSIPSAEFRIVGRDPGPKVRELERTEGITVTGFVPDIRPWLAGARVAVAPFSIAAGIQNKILEALASGLPVVATSRAAQGLSPSVAEIVEIGDTSQELASKVTTLLGNPELACSAGLEGRRRVTADYQWNVALGRMLEILEGPVGPEDSRLQPRSSLA